MDAVVSDGTTTGRVRVLLIDDEALMRAGLLMMIDGAHGIEVVGEAVDGHDGLALIDRLSPDVVLLDLRMPRMTGLEMLRALQERAVAPGETAAPAPRIVVLTAFDTDEFLLKALRAGATGFLLKDSPPNEVVAAVLDAAADRSRFSPDVLQRLVRLAAGPGGDPPGPAGVRPSAASGAPGSQRAPGTQPPPGEEPPSADSPTAPAPEGITDREWEVARLVAQGLSNTEIGQSLFMSVATVKTHLGRLYQKLQVTNRVQLAIRVLELGG